MKRKYKICMITTLSHNIGDDFVREGLIYLMMAALKQTHKSETFLDVLEIHKHCPVTNVFGFRNVRSLKLSKIIDPVARVFNLKNKIDECDLLIQGGAPIYWCHPGISHCADNEWFDPLVRRRFMNDLRGRKFLNLAGGSCQRYHSDGSEVANCVKCRAYIREFFDLCHVTTLRDRVAKNMLTALEREARVIPCSSIFARDHLHIRPTKGQYIVLNYMEGGGHFSFGQKIDKEKWRENFRKIVHKVSEMGRVVMACHNEQERDLARQVAPDFETFMVPEDHTKFVEFYAAARFGIVNRVHAGFMLASFGKPAAVIGTDTRALMISNLGLPSYFVEDVGDVEAIVDDIAAREHSYAEEAEAVRATARAEYVALLREAM